MSTDNNINNGSKRTYDNAQFDVLSCDCTDVDDDDVVITSKSKRITGYDDSGSKRMYDNAQFEVLSCDCTEDDDDVAITSKHNNATSYDETTAFVACCSKYTGGTLTMMLEKTMVQRQLEKIMFQTQLENNTLQRQHCLSEVIITKLFAAIPRRHIRTKQEIEGLKQTIDNVLPITTVPTTASTPADDVSSSSSSGVYVDADETSSNSTDEDTSANDSSYSDSSGDSSFDSRKVRKDASVEFVKCGDNLYIDFEAPSVLYVTYEQAVNALRNQSTRNNTGVVIELIPKLPPPPPPQLNTTHSTFETAALELKILYDKVLIANAVEQNTPEVNSSDELPAVDRLFAGLGTPVSDELPAVDRLFAGLGTPVLDELPAVDTLFAGLYNHTTHDVTMPQKNKTSPNASYCTRDDYDYEDDDEDGDEDDNEDDDEDGNEDGDNCSANSSDNTTTNSSVTSNSVENVGFSNVQGMPFPFEQILTAQMSTYLMLTNRHATGIFSDRMTKIYEQQDFYTVLDLKKKAALFGWLDMDNSGVMCLRTSWVNVSKALNFLRVVDLTTKNGISSSSKTSSILQLLNDPAIAAAAESMLHKIALWKCVHEDCTSDA